MVNTKLSEKEIWDSCIACICRGSVIYGTWHKGSDVDMYCILPNDADLSLYGYLDKFGECHREIHVADNIYYDPDEYYLDIQFLHISDYITGIVNGNVAYIELIWQNRTEYDVKYEEFHKIFDGIFKVFGLNKWNIRKWTSAQCNNSWAKCQKKMTVEIEKHGSYMRDETLYIGRKSLWHVFRLYDYAIQIVTYGRIKDYQPKEIKKLYNQIVKNQNNWIDLKKEYQHLKNEYATKLRSLVDKENKK